MNTERGDGGNDDSVDRDLIRRYREANAAGDERPSASVRASILAAAAREVGAKPTDAAVMTPRRARWPLAAAAAVMLSTLAVMLAIRTNEEMPQFSPEQPRTNEAAQKVAPAAPPATALIEAAIEEQAKRETQPPAAPALNRQSMPRAEIPSAPRRTEVDAAATTTSERQRQAPRASSVTAPASSAPMGAVADAAQPSPSTPAPEAAPANAKVRSAQAGSAAPSEARSIDQAAQDSRRDAGSSDAAQLSVAPARERAEASEPAGLWLERIIRLRREGRHVEADAELKRFRERYPQVQPPAEALAISGTTNR